jgi:6-pyruvoyltetrahydropterin/6-carboxytetrahydropterin synthase
MYTITRQIGVDAGHRVPTHGSKCKNVHGHRYTIEATCVAKSTHTEGEQQDMILDFGFLKEEMMKQIDEPCDHGFIIWRKDELLKYFLTGNIESEVFERIDKRIVIAGECILEIPVSLIGKMCVVPFIPTAEKLAEHWFDKLKTRVEIRSKGVAKLMQVKVWETPNCSAVAFPGDLLAD